MSQSRDERDAFADQMMAAFAALSPAEQEKLRALNPTAYERMQDATRERIGLEAEKYLQEDGD